MKKTSCIVSVVILFGCASTPEMLHPNNEVYQKLIDAKKAECVFTKGVYSVIEFDEEVEKEPDFADTLPWTMTITSDEQSEKATIYWQNSAGSGGTYTFGMVRGDGGISFVNSSIAGDFTHISIFDSDEINPKSYSSFYVTFYPIQDTDAVIYNASGECRVIE